MHDRASVTALVLVVLCLVPSDAAPQPAVKKVPMRPTASVAGDEVYKAYCENCHGEDLKGHGPDAAGLRVPPPDLTTIALRNGGKFSPGAVRDQILRWNEVPRTMRDFADKVHTEQTGEVTEAAHVMPAFGPIFAKLYPQEVRDREVRISNLIAHIKKKQVTSLPAEPPK
jgi:mono/diheme cytochrome c family protein